MPPAQLMIKPDKFIELPEDRALKLSEIIDNAKNNYAESFAARIRLESLQRWVVEQVENFNNSSRK